MHRFGIFITASILVPGISAFQSLCRAAFSYANLDFAVPCDKSQDEHMRVWDDSLPDKFRSGLDFLFLGFQIPVRYESLSRTRVLCIRGLLRRLSIRILSPVDTASEQCDCLSPAGWGQRHCVVREILLRQYLEIWDRP